MYNIIMITNATRVAIKGRHDGHFVVTLVLNSS